MSTSAAPIFTPSHALVVPEDLKRGMEKEVENDPLKLEARMKQVLYGKNTIGYDNYIAAVPREKRQLRPEHPTTPDIHEKISKRHFDGKIKAWRRFLHLWDNVDERPDSKPRQKRKAENLDGENTPTTKTEQSHNPQSRKFVSVKRQKVSDMEKISPKEEIFETPTEDVDQGSAFAIGEEENDGYDSEDVL